MKNQLAMNILVLAFVAIIQASPINKRSPQFVPFSPIYYSLPIPGGPTLYKGPNCTVETVTVTLTNCYPSGKEECTDVELPTQRIEYDENCYNVTVTLCVPGPIESGENDAETYSGEEAGSGEGEEAEGLETLPGLSTFGGASVLGYNVPPLARIDPCKEKEDRVEERCFLNPRVTEQNVTIKNCEWVGSVECEDVEHQIPKTVCEEANQDEEKEE